MHASNLNKPDETVAGSDVGFVASQDSPDMLVSASRRRLAKLGLGAPVLITLASRPVLAGQCLSNMMSGNLSDPNRGNCSLGRSPGGWGQPGGEILGYSTTGAWTKAGYNFGTFNADNCPNVNNPKETRYECYAEGTLLSTLPGALIKESFPVGTTMLQAVNASGTFTRHFVTAYLNASLSEADANFQYILTKQQVLDLATGTLTIPVGFPGYPNDIKTFLDSTWT